MEMKEGGHEDFISYLYSNNPKPIGSINLELPFDENRPKNIYLHTFEQLLMIFVDGLKYFYGDENQKVRLPNLTETNIQKLNEYFNSMNYHITIEIYPTLFEYQFRYPNYFKNQSLINDTIQLEDLFYETYDDMNCAYRVFFKKLV
jgi:hypothetical protein